MSKLLHNKRSTLILGIVALVLVALAGWKLVLSPALDAGNAQQASLIDTRNKITSTDQEIGKQCKILNDIQSVLAQARRNQAKFPPTADVSELFTQIRKAANSAGIPTKNITSVQAPAPAVGDISTVAEMPVTITVQASGNQVSRFLAALEAMPRSFIVNTMGVSPTDKGIAMTTNGAAYIIQTESLQEILDKVYKQSGSIKGTCHLQDLPTINNTPDSQPGTGDLGIVTPTTPGAGTTPTNPTTPGNTTPSTPPSSQLPIVPVQPPSNVSPNNTTSALPG